MNVKNSNWKSHVLSHYGLEAFISAVVTLAIWRITTLIKWLSVQQLAHADSVKCCEVVSFARTLFNNTVNMGSPYLSRTLSSMCCSFHSRRRRQRLTNKAKPDERHWTVNCSPPIRSPAPSVTSSLHKWIQNQVLEGAVTSAQG